MKVSRDKLKTGKEVIHIEITLEDAHLLQTATIQFAESIAKTRPHRVRMRRLAILIDNALWKKD